jgi:hypothetical protein
MTFLVQYLNAHRQQYCIFFLAIIMQDGKVAVRNIRRESVDKIKAAEKDKDIGKDDSKGFQVCSCFLFLLTLVLSLVLTPVLTYSPSYFLFFLLMVFPISMSAYVT